MKNAVRFVIVLLSFLPFSAVRAQESNTRLTTEVSASSGMGYRVPAYGLSAGATKRLSGRAVLDLYGHGLRARKIPGDGWHIKGSAELRVIVKRPFFTLGGLSINRQFTSFYEKVGSDPFIGGGWQSPDDRTFVSVRGIGNDVTSISKFQTRVRPADLNFHRRLGAELRVEHYQQRNERGGIYYAVQWNAQHFDCFTGANGPTRRCWGQVLAFRVGGYRK